MRDKPYYCGAPIANISSLAQALEINEDKLRQCANRNSEESYLSFPISREGKKDRQVVDAKPELKNIQKLINSRIMSLVEYPVYLMGGIKDEKNKRDYLSNSKLHLKKETLINLDIKDFFPSIKEEYVKSIFKQLFRYNDEVSELLTKLTTLNGSVPQGAATSTYIANLIFFNHEFELAKHFRKKSIQYSRLLDDITLSSDRVLTEHEVNQAVKKVVIMFKRYDLKLHTGKTRVEYKSNKKAYYEVTGAWVRFGEPKIRKNDRAKVRSAVRNCEKEYAEDPFSDSYHSLWNQTSGRVAQLGRFNHKKEEKDLRKRLSAILPLFNSSQARTIDYKTKDLVRRKKANKINIESYKTRQQVHKIVNDLGILSRNNKQKSIDLRNMLKVNFPHFFH